MIHDKKRVVVIGGGISGLAAAHCLAVSGASLEITVLEAAEKLGGVLQTEHVDGFCLEHGPDSLLSRQAWGVDLCRRVGLELINTNESQRGAYIVHQNRLQRIPEGLAIMAPQRLWPCLTTPLLSWRGKLRLAAERFIPQKTSSKEESLAAFSRRRLGREAFDRLVQPLASGIYMGDPEKLSVEATFPQFVAMESKHGSLLRAARAERLKNDPRNAAGGSQRSMFVAPRRGASQLVEAISKALNHCRIECGQRVESLLPDDKQGWSVRIVDTMTANCREETFAGVILATPAHQAGCLIEQASPELGKLLKEIPYTDCLVVNVAYRRSAIPHPLDCFGFVVPHIERRPILACTFCSVKYAHRAPEGTVLLRVYLGGTCFPKTMQWSDDEVLEAVLKELGDLLGISEPPLFSRIMRWDRVLPQYQVGHLRRVEKIEEMVGNLPALELAGNAYRGVGIPHCIHRGEQAGKQLAAALTRNMEVL